MGKTKINIENHEAYFLDYLEGRLDIEMITELEYFLEKHPECKEKLEYFDQIKLNKPSEKYPDKLSLKKFQFETCKINKKNFDDFCIAFFEHQLNHEKEKELLAYLALNPGHNKDFYGFEKAYLKSQQNIVFPNKELIYKRIKIADNYRNIVKWLSIAAGIAILITVYLAFLLNYHSAKQPDQFSKETLNSYSPQYVKKNERVIIQKKHNNHNSNIHNNICKLTKTNTLNKSTAVYDSVFSKSDKTIAFIVPIEANKLIGFNKETLSNSLDGKIECHDYFRSKPSLVSTTFEKITKTKIADLKNKNGKISVIKIAQLGLDGMNRIFNSNMKLTEKTDSHGNVIALSFESEAFEYHKTKSKNFK